MIHLLLLLCSLLTLLKAGVETLFPLLLTSAYYGLIFGERKFGSVFVSHYQPRPFLNYTQPAPSSQVTLVFHPLQTMLSGAEGAAVCHHTAVALQKDQHQHTDILQQLTQKKGNTVSCSVAEDSRIPWPPSSPSAILDSVILKVFSNLNDSLFTCLLVSTGQKKWGDTLGKLAPLSS